MAVSSPVTVFDVFASPSVRDSEIGTEQSGRFCWMLCCSFISTVYNTLLCLHIFSVHITHQNKKRNYENLDQLSYDNKRGPKVYLHGQCTPPTNFVKVATRIQPKPVTWPNPTIATPPYHCPNLGSTIFFSFCSDIFSPTHMISMKNGFVLNNVYDFGKGSFYTRFGHCHFFVP